MLFPADQKVVHKEIISSWAMSFGRKVLWSTVLPIIRSNGDAEPTFVPGKSGPPNVEMLLPVIFFFTRIDF